MNYLDYQRIMKEENLVETFGVKEALKEAITQQKFIKTLEHYGLTNFPGYHLTMKRKDEAIMRALKIARLSK